MDYQPAGLLSTLPRQSIRGFCIRIGSPDMPEQPRVDVQEMVVATSGDRILRVCIESGSDGARAIAVSTLRERVYVIGDDQDADQNGDAFLGHGALLNIDASSGLVFFAHESYRFPTNLHLSG
jgi:hypothetical protein